MSNREVILIGGNGYLSIDRADYLIETFFKRHLEDATRKTKKLVPFIEETFEDLAEYLDKIDNLFMFGKDYTKISLQRQAKINIADIDIYASQHFPLCMREMHKHLRQHHHLRHTGRVQYGLFLKGIGVSMEDALRFWKSEFTKKIPNDKFEKNYAYNIRHSYGKEGQRTDYTPWSCNRILKESSPSIINSILFINPGIGTEEFHGCPFKEYNERNLRRLLMEFNLTNFQTSEIIESVRGKHHQVNLISINIEEKLDCL